MTVTLHTCSIHPNTQVIPSSPSRLIILFAEGEKKVEEKVNSLKSSGRTPHHIISHNRMIEKEKQRQPTPQILFALNLPAKSPTRHINQKKITQDLRQYYGGRVGGEP